MKKSCGVHGEGDWFHKGIKWKVVDGSKTLIWLDKWLDNESLAGIGDKLGIKSIGCQYRCVVRIGLGMGLQMALKLVFMGRPTG